MQNIKLFMNDIIFRLIVKYKCIVSCVTIRCIYLIIFLIILVPVVFAENQLNSSNDQNITANYQNSSTTFLNKTNSTIQMNNQILNGGSSKESFPRWDMTLDITHLVYTFIAVLIALVTLLERRKQRQSSDDPKIYVAPPKENKFEVFWTKLEDLDSTFPIDWRGDAIEGYGGIFPPTLQIPLEVINAGLGPALNVKLTWKYDPINELIYSFNKLNLNIKIEIDETKQKETIYRIFTSKKRITTGPSVATPTTEIPCIIPYTNIKSKEKIYIPSAFIFLASLAIADYSLTKEKIDYRTKEINEKWVLKTPSVNGIMEYSDLGGTNHKSEFKVGLEFGGGLFCKIDDLNYEDGYKCAEFVRIVVKMKDETSKKKFKIHKYNRFIL